MIPQDMKVGDLTLTMTCPTYNGIWIGNEGIRFTNSIPELQQLVFDELNRTSIAFWKDGTKTIVRCRQDEEFSQEGGLSALYMKKMFGSRGVIDKMIESAKIVKPKVKKMKSRASESYIEKCTVSQEVFDLISNTPEV